MSDPDADYYYWLRFRNASFILFILALLSCFTLFKNHHPSENWKPDLILAKNLMENSLRLKESFGPFPSPHWKRRKIFGGPFKGYSVLEFEIRGTLHRGRVHLVLEREKGLWSPKGFRGYSLDGQITLFNHNLLNKKDSMVSGAYGSSTK